MNPLDLLRSKKSIYKLSFTPPREYLVRRSRILIVDDERPELIDDLTKSGFAVGYEADIKSTNIGTISEGIYDLLLLDFGNIGAAFGPDEGLSLLRHIKRTNPAMVILTYTSKALKTEHAEFYRLADATLAKDAGITDSMEKIEEGLRKAHSIPHLWKGFLKVSNIQQESAEDQHLQDLLVRGMSEPKKIVELRARVGQLLGSGSKLLGGVVIEKVIEAAIKAQFE